MRSVVRKLYASPTVRVVSGLAGSNFLALAVGIIGTLVQARFVGPAELGYFRSFTIAMGYAQFMQLGLMDYLQRYYPYSIGRGQREQGLRAAEIGQAYYTCLSAAVGGAFFLLGTAMFALGNWRAGFGWWTQTVATASLFYGGYLGITYRSGHDFARVAKGSLLSGVAGLVALPLFPIWSYFAMVVRANLGILCNLVYLHRNRPLRLPWRFSFGECLGQAKMGLPLFTAGYAKSIAPNVVQGTIILHFLGTTPLGLWSISAAVLEAASKIPQAIVAVYTPRLTEQYGRTHSVGECLRLCRRPMQWGLAGMLCCAVLCSAMIPFAVRILMPKYTAAIPSMWLMMAYVPLGVLELPYIVLVAVGKIGQINTASLSGLSVLLLSALAAIKLGLGLNGVIGAGLAGTCTRLVLIYMFAILDSRRTTALL